MMPIKQYGEKRQTQLRQLTHLGFSAVLIVIILIFQLPNENKPSSGP